MKTNLHKILLTGLFGMLFSAGASAETRTNKIMDKQSVIDSIVKPEKNLVIEREVTPKGDTIYRYKYQAVDLGPIEDKAPTILAETCITKRDASLAIRCRERQPLCG